MNERTHTFTVKAAFIKQPKVLYPNLSLEANIVLNTKKNAIVIPKEYLVAVIANRYLRGIMKRD